VWLLLLILGHRVWLLLSTLFVAAAVNTVCGCSEQQQSKVLTRCVLLLLALLVTASEQCSHLQHVWCDGLGKLHTLLGSKRLHITPAAAAAAVQSKPWAINVRLTVPWGIVGQGQG
jgi:hypothetical protein